MAPKIEHTVRVVGDSHSTGGCRAECSCGWFSLPEIGRRAHSRATSAKWAHVDETKGATT